MKSVRLTSTLLHSLRPVGTGSERDHGLLTDTLRREIGPDAAEFLAEPVPSQDGSKIDWYVQARNRPETAEGLDADARAEFDLKVEEIRASVDTLVRRLEGGSPGERDTARALRHAMEMPASGSLFRVDGKPVAVAWGYVETGRPSYESGLKAVGLAPATRRPEPTPPEPAPMPTATPVGRRPRPVVTGAAVLVASRFNWLAALLWTLFVLLLLAILWLLLTTCFLPRLGYFAGVARYSSCGAVVAEGVDIGRLRGLQSEVATLERQAVDANALCVAEDARLQQETEAQRLEAERLRGEQEQRAAEEAAREAETLNERLDEANAQSGQLQISLQWEGTSDLDLSILCPDGNRIFFRNKTGCGATLDVDANAGQQPTGPVENIFWAENAELPAEIPVDVTYFGPQTDPRNEIPYQLRIRRTTIDPATGERRVADEFVDGIARRDERNLPKRVQIIKNPAPSDGTP